MNQLGFAVQISNKQWLDGPHLSAFDQPLHRTNYAAEVFRRHTPGGAPVMR
jgi:hypothetical protein